MYVRDVDDVTRCRYFTAMLKVIGQKWFNGLPDGGIASFFKLAELCSTYFLVSKR